MNQPYPDSALFWIFVANLIALAGIALCVLVCLYRVLARRIQRTRANRRARRTADHILARTDFDTALAKLIKENGR